MRKFFISLVAGALAAVLVSSVGVAHDGTKPLAPRHGGQLVEDQNHHSVELVVSDNAIVFHMREHDEPLDVSGSKFKAIVQDDSGTRVLQLTAEGTKLSAALDAPLAKGAKIALSGKDAHGDIIQARFVME